MWPKSNTALWIDTDSYDCRHTTVAPSYYIPCPSRPSITSAASAARSVCGDHANKIVATSIAPKATSTKIKTASGLLSQLTTHLTGRDMSRRWDDDGKEERPPNQKEDYRKTDRATHPLANLKGRPKDNKLNINVERAITIQCHLPPRRSELVYPMCNQS